MPVCIRRIASSALTPITESCGPVIPASVIAAVPPGCTRASLVCTCVCVPNTAVTRPSSSARDGDLLARRLGVEVDEDDARLLARLLDERVEHLERADRRGHEQDALKVEHSDRSAVRRRHDRQPAARRARGEVRRPDHAVGALEVGRDLLPPPDVVAERERVGPGREQSVGQASASPLRRPRRSRR